MRLSIGQKTSLLATTLVIITAVVISGLFYQQQKTLLLQHALDKFSDQILGHSQQLNSRIRELRADTLLIAKVPPVQGLLRAAKNRGIDPQDRSTTTLWTQRLQDIFQVLLETQPDYAQVRFLDAQGMELVRVERRGDRIEVTPSESLQNKADRDYVIDTLQLAEGRVYLSEINLNREFGQVVTPHQEMLRSASPVFDEDTGTLAGLVVINMDLGATLHQLASRFSQGGRTLYVTNDRGDYLVHPDVLRTYGFDLGTIHRMQAEYPASESYFLQGRDQPVLNLLPQDTQSNQVLVLNKLFFDPDKPQRFLAMAIAQAYSTIITEVRETLDKVLAILVILILVATLLSILLSSRVTQPIKLMARAVQAYGKSRDVMPELPVNRDDEVGVLAQNFQAMAEHVHDAEHSLTELNANLEALVEERTRELRNSQIRHQVIVENIVDGLISINEQGIVQDFNHAAEKIFGYRAEEIIGLNVKRLMPEPYHSQHDGYLKAYHDSGEAKIIGIGREVIGKRKDGSTFPMDLAINEMWFGEQRFFSGIVRDITERKYVEKMKNEFISTVSHELRTPLTSIRGSLGLLLGGIVGKLPDQAMEMLRIAGNNTTRLLMLINDILDIQKIESGKMAFHNERFALMPFLEQAVQEHTAYGEQHHVRFVITQRVNSARLLADKARLMQVMGNLLSNAAKFSPEGEQVEIAVSRKNEDFLRIAVSDVGPGIPEDAMESLFEQFTQVDSSDTRKKGGTGLGLAITKAIVENLGGEISVDSDVGKGSTFYVDLPEARSSAPSLEEPIGSAAPASSHDILIVEDDLITASLIQNLFLSSGIRADIAYTAAQARERIEQAQYPYKVMILDLLLPDEDGISLLTSLRQQAANRDMEVVIVSVKADEARQELEGGALGVHDWINKPLDESRLLEAVHRLADPRRKLRVLHVEDEVDIQRVVRGILRDCCDIEQADSVGAARKKLKSGQFDLVLLDIGLPDGSGLDLIDSIKSAENDPKVVVFSALDVPVDYAQKVDTALLKAKTSNTDLLQAVLGAMQPQ